MSTHSSLPNLFYATSFEVFPENHEIEIWPSLIDVFQRWVELKEKRRSQKRPDSTFAAENKQKPGFAISNIPASALKWQPGMRMSAHSALSVRMKLATESTEWASATGYSAVGGRPANPVYEKLRSTTDKWESDEASGERYPYPKILLSKEFVQGKILVESDFSTLVSSVSDGGRIPKHWAMSYSEQDNTVWWRTWHTHVGITNSNQNSYFVTIQVNYTIDPTYMRSNPELPNRTVPTCVKRLLGIPGVVCKADGNVLSETPTYVKNAAGFEQFHTALFNPDRKMPLVLVTSNAQGKYPVDPDLLAKSVIGTCTVFAICYTSGEVNALVNERFGSKALKRFPYRPEQGSVGVYFPHTGVGADSALPEPYWFPSSRFNGKAAPLDVHVSSNIIACAVRSFSYPEVAVSSCADIQNLLSNARLLELSALRNQKTNDEAAESSSKLKRDYEAIKKKAAEKEKTHQAEIAARERSYRKQIEEKEQSYQEILSAKEAEHKEELAAMDELLNETLESIEQQDQQIAELNEYSELLEAALADAEEKAGVLQEKAKEVDKCRWEIEALKAQLGSQEGPAVSAPAMFLAALDAFPTTVLESLDLAARAWPDKLVVLDKARQSAQVHDSGDPNEAWQILRGLAVVMHPACFDEEVKVEGMLEDHFQHMTGYSVRMHESSATKKNPKLMSQRKCRYEGRVIDISPHVRGKTGKTGETMRVHFHVDNETNRIVIGHCGAHMETAGTRRKGF